MADHGGLPDRIVRQFSDVGDRAAVWRALDLVLETDAYLNLGYSHGYQTHLIGDPQRRLVDVIGSDLADRLPATEEVTLLDIGCGRGGPAQRLARRHGFAVTGVDLVPHNVRLARDRARDAAVPVSVLVGDATRLPVRQGTFPAAVAIDSTVYVDAKAQFYAEVARVLEPGGVAVVSDLVVADGLTPSERGTVDTFAERWDMPPIPTRSSYRSVIAERDLDVLAVRDITDHSVGRFAPWSSLFLRAARSPARGLLRRALARRGVDLDAVVEAVAAAHPALPHLRHVIVHVRRPA